MKKRISILVVLSLMLSLCSCSLMSNDTGKFKVVDGKELFFNGKEQIVDKLITFEGQKYYIKDDGTKAKNEWQIIDNDNTYAYFGAKGIMIKDDIREIDNQLYIFDKEGKLETNKLITIDGYDYYATKDGYLLRNQFKVVDGKDYYFDKDGKHSVMLATVSWVTNNNINGLGDFKSGYYCLDENGQRLKKTWQDDYYLGDDGLMLTDTWIGTGEDRVYVGADGKKQTDYKEVVNLVKDLIGSVGNSSGYSSNNSASSKTTYGQSTATWLLKYYVDEYEDYTNEPYLWAEFSGKMSNSVVTGRESDFVFLIDDYVYLKIWEYGTYQVKKQGQHYNISLKDGNGQEYNFTGYMSSDRIRVDNYGSELIINSLKLGLPIKMVITEDTSYNYYLEPTKYVIEVRADNFNSLYWK